MAENNTSFERLKESLTEALEQLREEAEKSKAKNEEKEEERPLSDGLVYRSSNGVRMIVESVDGDGFLRIVFVNEEYEPLIDLQFDVEALIQNGEDALDAIGIYLEELEVEEIFLEKISEAESLEEVDELICECDGVNAVISEFLELIWE